MQEEYPMQFRFRCAAVLTAVLLCSAAALPALAEETATPETADSVSTYTGWKTVNGKDYWYENGVKQGTTGRGKEIYDPDSDAWYWLDAKQGGAKAVNKDVYQKSTEKSCPQSTFSSAHQPHGYTQDQDQIRRDRTDGYHMKKSTLKKKTDQDHKK